MVFKQQAPTRGAPTGYYCDVIALVRKSSKLALLTFCNDWSCAAAVVAFNISNCIRILNSSPWIKEGGHERIFTALACGALPLTDENKYLHKHFVDGESIVFYHPSRLDKANHRINEYLNNDAKREAVISKGREIVMGLDTWDRRVEHLIQELPPFLKMLSR